MRTNQRGFSTVELIVIAAIVAGVGLVGFRVYNQRANKTADADSATATAQSVKADDVATAPAVSSTSDLDKAAATLDQTDPSGSNSTDAGQLDSQLANF